MTSIDLRAFHHSLSLNRFESFYKLTNLERDKLEEVLVSFSTSSYKEKSNFILRETYQQIEASFSKNLKSTLHKFRTNSNCIGAFLIENLPIDPNLPKTGDLDSKSTSYSEALLISFSHLFGTPYGYASQRNGKILQNLFPKKEHRQKQLGTGSTFLNWHTEDAFHRYRCDHIFLICLRGDSDAYTLVSKFNVFKIPPDILSELTRPNYIISSDEAHGKSFLQKAPILFINEDKISFRYDPMYTKCLTNQSLKAFEYLQSVVDENSYKIALKEGEVLIIDNNVSIHARSDFFPKFNGKDRWLQRIVTLNSTIASEIVKKSNPNIIDI
tara:strand:- start:1895 stop:2875 length:981 start_codon:yes stop_codon:yes gene_type:complete